MNASHQKGTVHQALASWPFWPNTVGPGQMPGSSGAVLSCNLGRVSWDPESARMPSYWCISGWEEKNNCCWLWGPCTLPQGSWKKLIPSRWVCSGCLHEGWPPSPPTSPACQDGSLSTLTRLHSSPQRLLWHIAPPSCASCATVSSPRKYSNSGSRVGGAPNCPPQPFFFQKTALYATSSKGPLQVMTLSLERWHVSVAWWGWD